MTRLLALGALLLAAPTALAQSPDPADVASPEAIVTAAYEAIARAPGQSYDWDRFRSLFLPQATLIPNTEQTGGAFRVLSPEDFIAWAGEGPPPAGSEDRGFAEEALHNEVVRYGDVAHVLSAYQKHYWEDDRILGRGVNSFQLVWHDGRWWIASIAWDEESGAGPIPDEFLE